MKLHRIEAKSAYHSQVQWADSPVAGEFCLDVVARSLVSLSHPRMFAFHYVSHIFSPAFISARLGQVLSRKRENNVQWCKLFSRISFIFKEIVVAERAFCAFGDYLDKFSISGWPEGSHSAGHNEVLRGY